MRLTAITAIATAACVVAVTGSRTLGPMGLHHRAYFNRAAHMHAGRMIGISLAESDTPPPSALAALPTLRAVAGVVLRGGLVPIAPEADFDWPPPEAQAFGEPPARQLLLGAVAGPAAGPPATAPAPPPAETPPSIPNLSTPMPTGGVLAGPQTGPTPPPPPGPPDPAPPVPTPPDPGPPAPPPVVDPGNPPIVPPVVLPDQPPPTTPDVPPVAPPPVEQPPVAVVPEPATWLMMILGLGLVGCALPGRRRKALGAGRLGNKLAR